MPSSVDGNLFARKQLNINDVTGKDMPYTDVPDGVVCGRNKLTVKDVTGEDMPYTDVPEGVVCGRNKLTIKDVTGKVILEKDVPDGPLCAKNKLRVDETDIPDAPLLGRVFTRSKLDIKDVVCEDEVDSPLKPVGREYIYCVSDRDHITVACTVNKTLGGNAEQCSCCRPAIAQCTEAMWSLPILKRLDRTQRGRAVEVVKSFASICLQLVGLAFELKLLHEYNTTGQLREFWLSLLCIIITAVLAGVFSLAWSVMDVQENAVSTDTEKVTGDGAEHPLIGTGDADCQHLMCTGDTAEQQAMGTAVVSKNASSPSEKSTTTAPNRSIIVCRTIATFVQLGRVFRLSEYIYQVCLAWRSKPADNNRLLRAEEERRDAAIIGLLEGFIGTAVLFQFQLYLMFTTDFTMEVRVFFEFASLFSITESLVSCYATTRDVDGKRGDVTLPGQCVYHVARLCEMGPRFLLLMLCLVYCGQWVLIGVYLHVVLMFVINAMHVRPDNGRMCHKNCTYLYYLFISYVEIYCFLNMNKGKSKYTAIRYYVIYYVENALMTSAVLVLTYTGVVPCRTWCVMAHAVIPGFVLHMTFLYLFYTHLHPTRTGSVDRSVSVCICVC